MQADDHPVVRGHAAWALGQIGVRLHEPELDRQLQEALQREDEATVRDEIAVARHSLATAAHSSSEPD
jgi:hypothetical protein